MATDRSEPPYLLGAQFRDGEPKSKKKFPFSLPWVESFELHFCHPVTFFVGENGSGKSTLLEAIAFLSGLPVSGGSRMEIGERHGPESESVLAKAMHPVFRKRPRDGFFFRAEFTAHFASLLEQRFEDPDFGADPYTHYGGKSLHHRSHGEAYLEIMNNRMSEGLFLLDEPESALSPQRQLALLALIAERVKRGSQFIIATHSPILMTYPGSQLISFDEGILSPIELLETQHYHITRGILENPEQYWKHLRPSEKESVDSQHP